MTGGEYTGPTYTKVRNDFLEREDLTAIEKIILMYLHGRKRQDGQPWEINREQIWTTLSLGHDATKKALTSLKEKGWLTDNRKRVRNKDGLIRRQKSCVVGSRRLDVVAPDQEVTVGGKPPTVEPTVGGKPPTVERFPRSHRRRNTDDGYPPSNKELSDEELSVEDDLEISRNGSSSQTLTDKDPWADDEPSPAASNGHRPLPAASTPDASTAEVSRTLAKPVDHSSLTDSSQADDLASLAEAFPLAEDSPTPVAAVATRRMFRSFGDDADEPPSLKRDAKDNLITPWSDAYHANDESQE